MITITNSIFDAQGADIKAKVYGITLSGSEDVVLSGCTFKNKGYSGILNHCTGSVQVKDCTFECENIYNPIEGSQQVNNGDLVVRNCEFVGAPGNNYICLYQVKDDSKHTISGCSFEPTVDNNIIRVSNKTSAKMNIAVTDCDYTFADGEPTDYTNFLLCQDYTNKNGVKQDFTGVSVELNNVRCNGVKLVEGVAPAMGGIFYVYEDGKGLITGTNDPVVTIR